MKTLPTSPKITVALALALAFTAFAHADTINIAVANDGFESPNYTGQSNNAINSVPNFGWTSTSADFVNVNTNPSYGYFANGTADQAPSTFGQGIVLNNQGSFYQSLSGFNPGEVSVTFLLGDDNSPDTLQVTLGGEALTFGSSQVITPAVSSGALSFVTGTVDLTAGDLGTNGSANLVFTGLGDLTTPTDTNLYLLIDSVSVTNTFTPETAATPEPSSWALMLSGCALLAVLIKRRKLGVS